MDNSTAFDISRPRHIQYNDAVFIVRIILAIIILPGNILVVLSVARFDHLKTIPNLFIVNLAVADMLTSFVTIPVYNMFYYYNYNIKKCPVLFSCSLLPFMSSLTFLVVIAWDRAVYIAKPFWYQVHVTKRRASYLAISCWIYSIFTTFVPLAGSNEPGGVFCHPEEHILTPWFIILGFVVFVVYAVMMTCLYLVISIIARKHARRIAEQTQCARVSAGNDVKVRKMLVTVLGVFYLCWTPQIALFIAKYMIQYQHPALQTIEIYTELVCIANSVINPLIYVKQNKQFNIAFRKVLCRDSQHNTTNTESVTAVSVC